jgi:hypothetical protein
MAFQHSEQLKTAVGQPARFHNARESGSIVLLSAYCEKKMIEKVQMIPFLR